MIKLWHFSEFNTVRYNDQMVVVGNLQDIIPNDTVPNVMIATFQGIGDITVEQIIEYQQIFDRVVLVCCDVPRCVVELIQQFDHPKIYVVTVGQINCIPKHLKIVDGLQISFAEVRRLYHGTTSKILEELNPMKSKNFYFDALLGMQGRPHRQFISQQIESSEFADKFYVREQIPGQSLEDAIATNHWEWPQHAVLIPETNVSDFGSNRRVRFSDTNMNTNISCIVPVEIYNKTCYSIIAETYSFSNGLITWNDWTLLTEKTAKPIIAKRLFIMFGGRGYLTHLHRLGFQTFHSVIDESYDSIEDNQQRWSSAFAQVEYLCQQPQEEILEKIAPILEHNHNLFMSRDWETEFYQEITTAITEF